MHRLAAVELLPAPMELRRMPFRSSSGVEVEMLGVENTTDVTGQADAPNTAPAFYLARRTEQRPARTMLKAVVDVDLHTSTPVNEVPVPEGPRRDAERALVERASLLAVVCQAAFEVFSPVPYLFFEPTDEAEASWLAGARQVQLPPLGGYFAGVAPGGARDLDFSAVLADRWQGTTLLSAALAAGSGIAKLHELIRVFENAFAKAGDGLVSPLTKFLCSYPAADLGYSKAEVKDWIKGLRDPATHADLKIAQRVLTDSDVQPYLVRIEQAAYDVLFNKATWHNSDATRTQRWGFASLNTKGDPVVVNRGGILYPWDDWDHFRAFRLNHGYSVQAEGFPTGWKSGTWYGISDEP
jgi:hypothetical protein